MAISKSINRQSAARIAVQSNAPAADPKAAADLGDEDRANQDRRDKAHHDDIEKPEAYALAATLTFCEDSLGA